MYGVVFIGVCTDDVDETSAPLMILEYMPFGDLLSFLQKYKYEENLCVCMMSKLHFITGLQRRMPSGSYSKSTFSALLLT